MTKKISFTKMVASGNDFVVIEEHQGIRVSGHQKLAREICDRKYGVGADGLLVLGKSRCADVKMRIFNADGSEASMCGNGARCVALFVVRGSSFLPCRQAGVARRETIKIETKAGIIAARVRGENVKIRLTDPKELKINIPIQVNGRTLRVNFINTGVPHTVIFVEGIEKIDVANLGRQIRYHKAFAPQGTNVDFVEILKDDAIRVRTYERGVEDETLACGTGSVASALITGYRLPFTDYRTINVHTQGGEILKVYFERKGKFFKDVWLEGKAKISYKGVYYV